MSSSLFILKLCNYIVASSLPIIISDLPFLLKSQIFVTYTPDSLFLIFQIGNGVVLVIFIHKSDLIFNIKININTHFKGQTILYYPYLFYLNKLKN
jgi:hypothetical protein